MKSVAEFYSALLVSAPDLVLTRPDRVSGFVDEKTGESFFTFHVTAHMTKIAVVENVGDTVVVGTPPPSLNDVLLTAITGSNSSSNSELFGIAANGKKRRDDSPVPSATSENDELKETETAVVVDGVDNKCTNNNTTSNINNNTNTNTNTTTNTASSGVGNSSNNVINNSSNNGNNNNTKNNFPRMISANTLDALSAEFESCTLQPLPPDQHIVRDTTTRHITSHSMQIIR